MVQYLEQKQGSFYSPSWCVNEAHHYGTEQQALVAEYIFNELKYPGGCTYWFSDNRLDKDYWGLINKVAEHNDVDAEWLNKAAKYWKVKITKEYLKKHSIK